MAEDVPDADDPIPRDVRLSLTQLGRDAPNRFGDDLDAALDAMPEKPVRVVIRHGFPARRVLDARDRFKN